jgi:hypothetical protein
MNACWNIHARSSVLTQKSDKQAEANFEVLVNPRVGLIDYLFSGRRPRQLCSARCFARAENVASHFAYVSATRRFASRKLLLRPLKTGELYCGLYVGSRDSYVVFKEGGGRGAAHHILQ